MLDRRVTRLEGMAPPRRQEGPSAAAVILNRIAALKGISGTRDLSPDEQREYEGLWAALGGRPC
jgi:hypothetical protein